ncbi:MAG: tRNA (guanosine(37)-N1)-methyltransferase TrmD [Gammaproteobacteria bacterium]|nr:tRNA (guanosine(37)-N1)-methyltransferase TrmD [Gammaproteobacteria bacterium]
MRIDVVTLFPQMFGLITGYGMTRRAVEQGQLQLGLWNPRDFTTDRHRTVDDHPYGGGPGMVMMYPPLHRALEAAGTAGKRVIYLSPQGRPYRQAMAAQWAAAQQPLLLVAGRYEGVDERFIEDHIDEEVSVGDYVLSGGELAAMIVIDSVARLLPGVLGAEESAQQDSFSAGLLEYPQYTRPAEIAGRTVPEVLCGGDHATIRRWRLKQALGRTWQKRPDLLTQIELDDEQRRLLAEYKAETDKV